VTTSTSGVLKFIKIRKELKDYFVFRNSQGVFFLSKKDVEIRSEVFKSSGKISSSLWESMVSNSIHPDVILDFADTFSWSIDFLTEVRDKDTYKIVYEVLKTDTGKPVSKKILAAVYDGAETGRKTAIFFKNNYYDETGDSLKSFFLRAPLNYRRISSYFSLRRFHPVLRIIRPHYGIDYAARTGTPVVSVADGIVTFAGWKGGYGKFIQIKHNSAYSTGYGHLSRYAKNIRKEIRVQQGQVIGYVGSTGVATGPHLDFNIKKSGKFINFLKLKRFSTGRLPKKDTEEFKTLANQYFDKI
jgi:murein DD-endopeptidase MepM/ murein hydrolase activator NlpD